MRLKTLPLAISGAIAGNILAYYETGILNFWIFTLCITTAVLLQILSNFANDYGDFTNGVDTIERSDRLLTSGKISLQQMKFAVYLAAGFSLISGLTLLFISIQIIDASFFVLLSLGILGILAAYFYTSGKKPYGYIGLGDLSVFIFFGVFSVIGSYYLQTKSINSPIWFIAIAMGLLSVGVLNINNIRDIQSDQEKGKKTIPVQIGKTWAIRYHFLLLIQSVIMLIFYAFKIVNWGFVIQIFIILVLLMHHFNKLTKCENRMQFNQQLKQLSLSTLFIIILYCTSLFYFS
jgi:1,4-dihydroxy-2-naphthoate polyprenyltransferase